jgi:menaquinone-9 beta-reductase
MASTAASGAPSWLPATSACRAATAGPLPLNALPCAGRKNFAIIPPSTSAACLGEGIYYAHRSAELAAQVVLEGFDGSGPVLAAYRQKFRCLLLPEMRYAWAGRQILFALPRLLHYPLLSLFLRLMPKIAEQTIQGQRSFRWFRLKTPCPH